MSFTVQPEHACLAQSDVQGRKLESLHFSGLKKGIDFNCGAAIFMQFLPKESQIIQQTTTV